MRHAKYDYAWLISAVSDEKWRNVNIAQACVEKTNTATPSGGYPRSKTKHSPTHDGDRKRTPSLFTKCNFFLCLTLRRKKEHEINRRSRSVRAERWVAAALLQGICRRIRKRREKNKCGGSLSLDAAKADYTGHACHFVRACAIVGT